MRNTRKQVSDWEHRTKNRLIKIFGGGCAVCGYDRFYGSLEFHHVDPKQKDFSVCSWKNKNWEKILCEAKKCVMVCSNCHREIHGGVIPCPEQILIDISYEKFETLLVDKFPRICPVCKKEFFCTLKQRKKYCSNLCYSIATKRNFVWPEDAAFVAMVEEKQNYSELSRILGISRNSIRCRYNQIKRSSRCAA